MITKDNSEKIKQEFLDTADSFYELTEEASKITTGVSESDKKRYDEIKDMGFGRSLSVHERVGREENIKVVEDAISEIKTLQLLPYKLIEVSQLFEILNKWDLYIGHSNLFGGEIPQQKADCIRQYYNSAIAEGNDNTFWRQSLETTPNEHGTFLSASRTQTSYGRPSFYVCAPKKLFTSFGSKEEKIRTIGREVYLDRKIKFPSFASIRKEMQKRKEEREERKRQEMIALDPIVVVPISGPAMKKLGLKLAHIVTAWGPEAADPMVRQETIEN